MADRQDTFRWIEKPETRRIIDLFGSAEVEMRFVGGCVRDSLCGREIGDIDIATAARPEAVQKMLHDAGIKSVPTGIEHGTLTAIVDGQAFEITTYRRDVETDGRHAVVSFGTDWQEDAARRDFTINALSITPDGTLCDPLGGAADLKAGRIRFVGEARRRVREDILRVLRWFRFYAHFGNHPPDAEALEACRGFAFRIPDLSGERVRHELLRLLEAADPLPSLRLMQETGVIDAVLGRGRRFDLLAGLCEVEQKTMTASDRLLRLAALFGQNAIANTMAVRLRLSNKESRRIADALSETPTLTPAMTIRERRRLLYPLAVGVAEDRIRLAWAASPGENRWADWLEMNRRFDRPVFPLNGRDVYWLPEGPDIGEVLKLVEAWWIAEDIAPDRTACLGQLALLKPA